MNETGSAPAGASANELELRRSSAEFLSELDRLGAMERRKRDMASSDDQRVTLAREIEDATMSLVGLSRYQTRLIELEQQSQGEREPSTRKPAEVLEEWRAAERVLRDARTTLERATDLADQLRVEHRRSLEAQRE